MEYDVGPVHVAFPAPARARRCEDVLEWCGAVTLAGQPAGRLRIFEIDQPRLRLRKRPLGDVLSSCLDGAYRELLDASARTLWKGLSSLLVFEAIRLFPSARGRGLGLEIVPATVEQFMARGVGAVVMKAMPLQFVDGAWPKWEEEMGSSIGSRPWFVVDALEIDVEAYEKVAAYWRRLGWREISGGRKPTFLLEVAE